MAARVIALVLLFSTAALSQNQNAISIESPKGPAAEGGTMMVARPHAPLPDSPRPQKVIDKKFILVMSGLGIGESLRFTTRQLTVEHEFDAGAPWIRRVPSDQDLVAKHAGIYAAELAVAFELKKPHSWLPGDRFIRKLWWTYPAVVGVIHVKNGISNIRAQAPGGCSSIQCAGQTQ